jgi:hypothetical protein
MIRTMTFLATAFGPWEADKGGDKWLEERRTKAKKGLKAATEKQINTRGVNISLNHFPLLGFSLVLITLTPYIGPVCVSVYKRFCPGSRIHLQPMWN